MSNESRLTGVTLQDKLISALGKNSFVSHRSDPNHVAWTLSTDECFLHKDFKFKSFRAAMGFWIQIAMAADKMNHHPEWSNVYNRVSITLTTHSANGLTELDLKLARIIDRTASIYNEEI